MKTQRFFLIAFLALFCAFSSQAQIRFGVKGGINIAKATFDVANVKDNFDVENITGFQVGPTMEAMLPALGLGFDIGLLYTQRGFKLKDKNSGEDATARTGYLELPVNAKFKFGPSMARVFVAAGPYVSVKISQNTNLNSLSATASNIIDDVKTKTFSAGLNFGLGVELFKHLQVGANYALGLTEDYKDDQPRLGDIFHPKSSMWSITAAYYF